MNIFYLSAKPKDAARMACDKHVVKMILESTQLLYTAQWLSENNKLEDLTVVGLTPYKQTHKNHPSAIWTRASIENYKWLCELGLEYCEEYRFRYEMPGKPKEHASKKHLDWLVANPPDLPSIPFADPPQCMPDKYKNESAIIGYRQFYIGDKLRFVKYTRREPPDWIAKYL